MQVHRLFREIRHRLLRNSATIALPLLALYAVILASSSAQAVTRTWVNFGSGTFNNPDNWFPFGIPGGNDFVSFEVGTGNPYTVTFPGNQAFDPAVNYTTSYLRVRDNGVTFSGSTQALRGPSTYTVANTMQTEANRGIIIGVTSGENASLSVSHSGITCCGLLSSFSGVAATLGDAAGAAGTLNMNVGTFNVTGSDFTQTQLIVGNNGTGTLNLNGGADVNVPGFNSRVMLGNQATGVGAVNISGAGSTFTVANQLWVGGSGDGALTVQNGGALINNGSGGTDSSIIGTFMGSDSMVTVTGMGSTWTNNTELRVGNSGNGTLMIADGGALINNAAVFTPTTIGGGSNASGTATVTGTGSTWTTASTIHVGGTGTGALAILNGGSVTSGSAMIRGLNSGSGQVLVSGAGSTWTVIGPLTIGLPEPGFTTGPTSLTINPGGTVLVGGDVDLNTNSLLKLQGGTLASGAIYPTGGAFQWTSGTLSTTIFDGDLTNQAGTLAPGRSIGSTNIFGNYIQQANGAMEFEISNPSFPGSDPERDFVFIDGTASLNGELRLELIDGFMPTGQESFGILTAATGLSGAFSNVSNAQRLNTLDGSGSFLVNYGANSPFAPNSIVLSDFLAGLLGDFNGDGSYDVNDVDGLVEVIAGGTQLPQFDLTGNGLVDTEDLNAWLAIAGATNNPSGNPYRLGDANLNGSVDASDFNVWNAHKFTAAAAWSSGDFTANGSVDASDFNVWNAHKFTSSDGTAVVPEPGLWALLLPALLLGRRSVGGFRKHCVRGSSDAWTFPEPDLA